ncbi:unnamed protein product [Hapterophycus canaliculatus]
MCGCRCSVVSFAPFEQQRRRCVALFVIFRRTYVSSGTSPFLTNMPTWVPSRGVARILQRCVQQSRSRSRASPNSAFFANRVPVRGKQLFQPSVDRVNTGRLAFMWGNAMRCNSSLFLG